MLKLKKREVKLICHLGKDTKKITDYREKLGETAPVM